MPDQAITLTLPSGVQVGGALKPGYARILSPEALEFAPARYPGSCRISNGK